MKAHLPLVAAGAVVFELGPKMFKASMCGKRWLCAMQNGDSIDVYRIPDHTSLSDPLFSVTGHLSELDNEEIKSIIKQAAK